MEIEKMGHADWIGKLSDSLFWDVDRNTVNSEKHLRWVLERVLERGEYEDWVIIKNNVSVERMRAELYRLRVGPKAHNFLKRYVYAVDSLS